MALDTRKRIFPRRKPPFHRKDFSIEKDLPMEGDLTRWFPVCSAPVP